MSSRNDIDLHKDSGWIAVFANNRLFLGLFLPFFLEFLIFALYNMLKTGTLDFTIFLPLIFFIFPCLFLYISSPYLIFYGSRVRTYLSSNLLKNLEAVFLGIKKDISASTIQKVPRLELKTMAEELSNEEEETVLNLVERKLVPKTLEKSRKQYVESYFTRNYNNRAESLITYYESIFLFSGASFILNMFNIGGLMYLHYNSINLDFMTIDKITNTVNVTVFLMLFLFLSFISIVIFRHSSKQICLLFPQIIPVLFEVDPEAHETRLRTIQSISRQESFIETLFPRNRFKKANNLIWNNISIILSPLIKDEMEYLSRKEIARADFWDEYRTILKDVSLSEDQLKGIERAFLGIDLDEIISPYSSSEEEQRGVRLDLEYVRDRLMKWSEISNEDKTLVFLLFYRTSEHLLRSLASKNINNVDELQFPSLISTMRENSILSEDEYSLFNEIRMRRNELVHRPGTGLNIDHETLHHLFQTLIDVLQRSD
ncbi:MAG: hypothetical protein ACTSYA_10010 [Candidatus Kariarchaeaceae archaeon]